MVFLPLLLDSRLMLSLWLPSRLRRPLSHTIYHRISSISGIDWLFSCYHAPILVHQVPSPAPSVQAKVRPRSSTHLIPPQPSRQPYNQWQRASLEESNSGLLFSGCELMLLAIPFTTHEPSLSTRTLPHTPQQFQHPLTDTKPNIPDQHRDTAHWRLQFRFSSPGRR
ncbi:uncharacterized protein BDV17DRAFT_160304 [Aspergillus undulatus]|uniref:uncharacterized protein n=1 Tax=Aspergillus undulatus TaxID=1810928 RepID=UPI003CCC94C3